MLHAQHMLAASVVTTTCWDTCYKGTPASRKARSVQGMKEQRLVSQSWGWMHLMMCLCVSALKQELVKSPIQDLKIQDWS